MFCPFDAADRPLASLPRSPAESLNRPGQRVLWQVCFQSMEVKPRGSSRHAGGRTPL